METASFTPRRSARLLQKRQFGSAGGDLVRIRKRSPKERSETENEANLINEPRSAKRLRITQKAPTTHIAQPSTPIQLPPSAIPPSQAQAISRSPQNSPQSPQTKSQSPQTKSQSPQNNSRSPQTIPQSPQNNSQSPQTKPQSPQTKPQSPQANLDASDAGTPSPSRSKKVSRHRSPSSPHVAIQPKGKAAQPLIPCRATEAEQAHSEEVANLLSKKPSKPILRSAEQELSPTLQKVWASESEYHMERLVQIHTQMNTPTKRSSPKPFDPTPLKSTPRKLKFKHLDELVEPHYYSPTLQPKRRLSKSPENLHLYRDMRTGKNLSPSDYRYKPVPDDWDLLENEAHSVTSDDNRAPGGTEEVTLHAPFQAGRDEEEKEKDEGNEEEREVEEGAAGELSCEESDQILRQGEHPDGLAYGGAGCILS